MRPVDWDGRPPAVPLGWSGAVPVGPNDVDADGDGTPDTVVAERAIGGAWVFTDTDADGFADRVLDLRPCFDGGCAGTARHGDPDDGPAPVGLDPVGAVPDHAQPDDYQHDGILDALIRFLTGR